MLRYRDAGRVLKWQVLLERVFLLLTEFDHSSFIDRRGVVVEVASHAFFTRQTRSSISCDSVDFVVRLLCADKALSTATRKVDNECWHHEA